MLSYHLLLLLISTALLGCSVAQPYPPESVYIPSIGRPFSNDSLQPHPGQVTKDITINVIVEDLQRTTLHDFDLSMGLGVSVHQVIDQMWSVLSAQIECASVFRLAYGTEVIVDQRINILQIISEKDIASGYAQLKAIVPKEFSFEHTFEVTVFW